ncbi:MAG: DUF1566 domain-containing protein [Deltaproteobacteria bacterium]|nr:DUF1566 domain-containing protein [Deltaproteobacteria bacterium]TLN02980.1 MAG: DUF1566 domain-containing protein [bacterium]
MAIFAQAKVIKVLLAVFLAFGAYGLFQPEICYAEKEISTPEDETFVLPESRVLWTRDGNPAGSELTWSEAQEFLNDLNRENFAGCSLWRLPLPEELAAMLIYLDSGNADNEDISLEPDYYWVTSANGLESDYAEAVNMEDGSTDSNLKSESNYVWPVCDR